MMPSGPGFVFDLDGTLVDSVYQHVVTWTEALREAGIEMAAWKVHRRVGMSGGLLTQELVREAGRQLHVSQLRQIQERHAELYRDQLHTVRPLPGAIEILQLLTRKQVPWSIATSGRRATAEPALDLLSLSDDAIVVTHEEVTHAKPDPDLFLEAVSRMGVTREELVIVGDSVWDLLAARRARALGIAVLSGGYGREELEAAGAYRVYDDPAALLAHLDEVGVRT